MMRDKNMFPLRVKLFLLAAFLILLTCGAWFYVIQEKAMRKGVEANLVAIAQLKANQIASWREERLRDASVLQENPFLSQAAARFLSDPHEGNAEELRIFFRSLIENCQYDDVLLVDPDGRVRLNLSERIEDISGYASTLKAALRDHGPGISPLHTDVQYPAPHISIVAPLSTGAIPPETPIGAIILVRDASRFLYPLIQSWPVQSETAETLVVMRDGDDVLFLNDLRHQPDTGMKLRIPVNRADKPSVMALMGREGVVTGRDYRDVKVVAAILPVSDSGWFMVAKMDTAEAFAEWYFRAVLILSLIAVLSGITVASGLVVWQRDKLKHTQAQYRSEAALHAVEERYVTTMNSIGDAVIATNVQGRVEFLNPSAEALTGWSDAEARGRPLGKVFRVVNEETRAEIENTVIRVLREGLVVGRADHTLLIARDGTEVPISNCAAPIRPADGSLLGVVLVFRDHSSERNVQRLTKTRLNLLEYATTHTLDELLTRSLDEISALVDSPIGFYHFLEDDQTSLSLQRWSTRTLQEFCKAGEKDRHYTIDKAGVWMDCVRERRPVIHNDYESLAHRKGLPEGHARVHRELVVPVMRKNKIVAVLGVGNKATDYTEGDLETVAHLADVTWQIFEHKRDEEALQQSREKYRAMVDNIAIGVSLISPNMEILELNRQMREWFPQVDPEGRPLCYRSYHNPPREGVCEYCPAVETLKDGLVHETTTRTRQAGGDRNYHVVTSPLLDGDGRIVSVIEMVEDVTEKLSLESQLRQAQKMESIGRLVGGVAHDYNNILGVILGYTELVLGKMEPGTPLHANLTEIYKAALRSIEITRQLLAFARKQTIAPAVFDLNKAVEKMLKMLRQLIGEDIELVWHPAGDGCPVKMDPVQLDQILANLCVNARDAIEGVGRVTIETGKAILDEAFCSTHRGFVPGEYMLLVVGDNGCGMDGEILENIFEPFFTTKEAGRGTGLGLATVYGIVKQNQGFIDVTSEPGKGTAFSIFLPPHEGPVADVQEPVTEEIQKGRGETILVADDDPGVRKMCKTMLEGLGYRVLAAGVPGEAVALSREQTGEIHLLLTDVVMPGMNGKDLADRLRSSYPNMGCLFMSGYSADVIAHRGILDEGINFIKKPFSEQRLSIQVREVLDQGVQPWGE
jgi:PAS domain S-box-containing protein